MGKVSYGFTALNDFYYTQAVLDVKPFNDNYNPALVNLQQITERILKHVIAYEYEITDAVEVTLHSHSLFKLVKLVKQHYPGIVKSIIPLTVLDMCYFTARYPGNDYIQYDYNDYRQGINEMMSVLKWFIFEVNIDTVLPVYNAIKNIEDTAERFKDNRQLLWDLLNLDLPVLKE